MPTLVVVGAGPKGIAIAAKARALEAAGLDVPRVVLVDRGAVAGNWTGRQGYTSGLLPLGTPAEKDVGFLMPITGARLRLRSLRRWRITAGSGI
jgi:mycobactin lysine-N-oxygenase